MSGQAISSYHYWMVRLKRVSGKSIGRLLIEFADTVVGIMAQIKATVLLHHMCFKSQRTAAHMSTYFQKCPSTCVYKNKWYSTRLDDLELLQSFPTGMSSAYLPPQYCLCFSFQPTSVNPYTANSRTSLSIIRRPHVQEQTLKQVYQRQNPCFQGVF